MWNTFGPDLLVALFGAVITVVIAVVTYAINRRIRDTQALRALVGELSHRRAFVVGLPLVVKNAVEIPDFARASASILSVKEEVRRTRDQVRPNKAIQDALAAMTIACNRYLELSSYEPDDYLYELVELRSALQTQVAAIARINPKVPNTPPGGKAL